MLWIGLLLVIVLARVGYILTLPQTTEPQSVATVSPTSATTTDVAPVPTSTPTPTLTPRESATIQPSVPPVMVKIDGGIPTQLYVPRLSKTIVFDTKTCPVVSVDGQAMLDPDRDDFTKSCYFVNKAYPYVLPSTDAPDLAVFAGHTSRNRENAAFNIFYDWQKREFTLKSGDEVWVKTKTSGPRWLVYKATDFLTPEKYAAGNKVSLMNDPRVWGTAPTPGVLVTIGCLQPKDTTQRSRENIVIKWTFDRVEE